MSKYDASSIEVLTGLEPVQKRPGMYTDTSRPNHLAQEVIDNSVDEAIAGHAKKIEVMLYKDGSLSVTDDGRGMPIDIHPEEGIPGVEVILTRLHAGGKFSNKNYEFSGGLHGVGVSVVNALSSKVTVEVRRDGKVMEMAFKHGAKTSKLKKTGTVGKRNTGTKIHFWPEKKYFDAVTFSVKQLKHVLRAKAVLCSGLEVSFTEEKSGKAKNETETWCYEGGLADYLGENLFVRECMPEEPFIGSMSSSTEAVDWALTWQTDAGELTS